MSNLNSRYIIKSSPTRTKFTEEYDNSEMSSISIKPEKHNLNFNNKNKPSTINNKKSNDNLKLKNNKNNSNHIIKHIDLNSSSINKKPVKNNKQQNKTKPKSQTAKPLKDKPSASITKNNKNKTKLGVKKPSTSVNKTLKNIKTVRNKNDFYCIRKLPFQRFVKQISQDISKNNNNDNFKFSKNAVNLLQAESENYIISLIEDAYLCTLHSKRVTLMIKDIRLARRIRGQNSMYFDFL